MDNIAEYEIYSKQIDDTSAEYYIFFKDTYSTRYFSSHAAVNSYISIPANETLTLPGGEPPRLETVRIYYCIFTFPQTPFRLKTDFREAYLIWER